MLNGTRAPPLPPSRVFFQLLRPKNDCARPLGNSDIWNLFRWDLLCNLTLFKGRPAKKITSTMNDIVFVFNKCKNFEIEILYTKH